VHPSQYDGVPFVPEFYDYVVPYATRPDVAFYVEIARESRGPVLEIGCGTGRVLIPTARAGIPIVGLDSSEAMLAECRRRLDLEPPEVRQRASALPGDMRDFELGRTFGLVTVPFRPFQHLALVTDQLACLETIRRHLEPEGRLVFDVFNPSVHNLAREPDQSETADEPPFTLPDGRSVVRRQRMLERNLVTQVNTSELIYYVTHPDGRQERLVHRLNMRCFFRFELEHLLGRAGFVVEQVYSDFNRSAYGAQYPGDLVVVAKPSKP
jgi:SAM-dependent methyltransferase